MIFRLRERRSDDLWLAWLWFAIAVAGIALAPLVRTAVGLLPRCAMKALTGWPCPTCGSSRAAEALARFDVLEALRQNPLTAAAAMAFFVLGVVAPAFVHLKGRVPEASGLPPRWLFFALLGVAALNWAYLVGAGV